MLTEIYQAKTNTICGITYMWNLTNKTNKMHIAKQKQTHRYTEQISGYQWGKGRRKGHNRDRGLTNTNYYI